MTRFAYGAGILLLSIISNPGCTSDNESRKPDGARKGTERKAETSAKATAGERTSVRSLFDGRSLAGWSGNETVFRVVDGAIVGGSTEKPLPHNEFLTCEAEFADFELRLRFRLRGAATNAGIQVRSRRLAEPAHEMKGYQADLGKGYWGCLYDESRRNRVLAGPDKEQLAQVLKPGDWNDYRIRCEGRRIRLWINEMLTVDYTEEDLAIEQTGLIGLQIHGGPPGEAWYKDIEIEEL